MTRRLRVGYADPPYLGMGKRMYGRHHRRAGDFDRLDAHADLVGRLCREFPDGWALSCSSPSLRLILPLCPPKVRVAAWVKPFARYRPGVCPTYAWEPVIFSGGRRRGYNAPMVRDWVSCNIAMRTGLRGSKPPAFCRWLFDLLGLCRGDVLVDLFPGSGAVGRAWREFCHA